MLFDIAFTLLNNRGTMIEQLRVTHFIWSLVLGVFLGGAAYAQIDTGSIVGTVRDASGAVVPDASVSATSLATNIDLTTVTNKSGEYQFNALQPGDYKVKAVAHGFASQETELLHIDVQSRSSVDFTLKVGNINETVEVQSTAPLLDTQTANLGGVVNTRQIEDLPLTEDVTRIWLYLRRAFRRT